ncbi:unnamed protein product [Fraxinus pennsylvanica]|uniref:Uncharacterized protein n=1 Tax=Fraxinus pennsylvanica TaxID=56036 RepID=A0AAD2DQC0_9LAMI|nr:unnamed protein product [Fraxinus pennsylvanica]
MAVFKYLFSQTQRYYFSKTPLHHISSLLLHRLFSAEPDPDANPNFPDQGTRTWTQDEMRYIEDALVIFPISYPSRVVPLPEDRVKEENEGSKNESDELEREMRRIDDERWNAIMTRRWVLGED